MGFGPWLPALPGRMNFAKFPLLRAWVNRARDGEHHSCPVVVEPLISVVLVFPCFCQLAENATYIFVEVFCYFLLLIHRTSFATSAHARSDAPPTNPQNPALSAPTAPLRKPRYSLRSRW